MTESSFSNTFNSAYNPPMAERPLKSTPPVVTPLKTLLSAEEPPVDDRMVCERCGNANVYRMHAVWRCSDCGFKTDCCGW